MTQPHRRRVCAPPAWFSLLAFAASRPPRGLSVRVTGSRTISARRPAEGGPDEIVSDDQRRTGGSVRFRAASRTGGAQLDGNQPGADLDQRHRDQPRRPGRSTDVMGDAEAADRWSAPRFMRRRTPAGAQSPRSAGRLRASRRAPPGRLAVQPDMGREPAEEAERQPQAGQQPDEEEVAARGGIVCTECWPMKKATASGPAGSEDPPGARAPGGGRRGRTTH